MQKIGLRGDDFPFVKPIRFINDTNVRVACAILVLTRGWTYPFVSYNNKKKNSTINASRFVMLKYVTVRIHGYLSRIFSNV